jgi:hypothetical protein
LFVIRNAAGVQAAIRKFGTPLAGFCCPGMRTFLRGEA